MKTVKEMSELPTYNTRPCKLLPNAHFAGSERSSIPGRMQSSRLIVKF